MEPSLGSTRPGCDALGGCPLPPSWTRVCSLATERILLALERVPQPAEPSDTGGTVTTPPPGELALVLHTHLPYVARHGVWPVGEEWLLQAWGTSWLPVTRVLERLADAGRRELLTLSVTPTTAWQLADERLASELAGWLASATWRSEEQRWHHRMGSAVTDLGPHWWRHFADLASYHADVQSRGGLLAVWDALARAGAIEILAGPATHAYLPLESDPRLVDAQLATGLAAHASWTRWSGGLWPPELGYRPAGPVGDPTLAPVAVDADGTPTLAGCGTVRAGLEEHFAAHGVTHIVVDGPTLIRAAGGPARDWTRRPDPVPVGTDAPDEVLYDSVWIADSDVIAFGRDLSVAYHVWSPSDGYPGNAWYLDHHATGGFGVHRSWRVTDRSLPPDAKLPYVPQRAERQAEEDADHFVGVVGATLADRPGALVVAAYDTELFGHWWHEGPSWLGHVLERVSEHPQLRTTTLASRRERRPPSRRLALPESSWGYAKGHGSWVSAETRSLWTTVRATTELARQALSGGTGSAQLRHQVAREVALLHASDWPFMMGRGRSPGYALERVTGHADRVTRLCQELMGEGTIASTAGGDPVPPDATAFLRALDPDDHGRHGL
jgi:1,4-alpha-glucan branching enzyme